MMPKAVDKMKCCLMKSVIVSMTLIISPAYANEQLKVFIAGDSISQGVLADASGLKSKSVNENSPFFQWLVDKFFVDENFRWADGVNIRSVKRLLAMDGIYTAMDNEAKAGARTEEVLNKQIVNIYNTHKMYDFGIVFVAVNDMCDGIPVRESIDNMVQIAAATTHISRKVYLVPMPRVDTLHVVAKGKRTKWGLKAETVWKLHGICPRLTYKGEQYAKENADWINSFNMALEDIEMFDPRIRVTTSVHGVIFGPQHISNKDAFHPGVKGQELIAKHIFTYVRQDHFPPAK